MYAHISNMMYPLCGMVGAVICMCNFSQQDLHSTSVDVPMLYVHFLIEFSASFSATCHVG